MHLAHSEEAVCQWAEQGCRSAGIGCLECKAPLIDSIKADLAPLQERAGLRAEPRSGTQHSGRGAERARDEARETLIDVRQAMGLNYR